MWTLGARSTGYDAVHCAAAVMINEPEVLAVTGDKRLINAWQSLGVAVIDTNVGFQPGCPIGKAYVQHLSRRRR